LRYRVENMSALIPRVLEVAYDYQHTIMVAEGAYSGCLGVYVVLRLVWRAQRLEFVS